MIGFAGMSHLGIVSCVAAAAKGFDVIAYDPNPAICDDLGRGQLPLSEPGLNDLLAASGPRIRFTADPGELKDCGLIYVSLDVPTDEDNRSDLLQLHELIGQTISVLTGDTVLIILSQVPVGFTRRLADSLAAVEEHGEIRVFCQVETLIFGRAVDRALNPELVIVGCLDGEAALPPVLAEYLAEFGCPVLPMRYESAELAKLSINAYLVSSISVANTLAELCERLGADWSEIEAAMRLDQRIGTRAYISPGLGLSGGHLERDLATIRTLAVEFGTHYAIVDAWDSNSRYRRDWMLRTIHSEINPKSGNPTIAVWGIAYKPDTASTQNSPALELIGALNPFPVRAYDPLARLNGHMRPGVVQEELALDACRGAEALVITTPWQEFMSVDLAQIQEVMTGHVIIDPFGIMDGRRCADLGFSYFRLGTLPTRPYSAP